MTNSSQAETVLTNAKSMVLLRMVNCAFLLSGNMYVCKHRCTYVFTLATNGTESGCVYFTRKIVAQIYREVYAHVEACSIASILSSG